MLIKVYAIFVTVLIAYIVCVTKAAMYFNNPKILCWYLLILVFNLPLGGRKS